MHTLELDPSIFSLVLMLGGVMFLWADEYNARIGKPWYWHESRIGLLTLTLGAIFGALAVVAFVGALYPTWVFLLGTSAAYLWSALCLQRRRRPPH